MYISVNYHSGALEKNGWVRVGHNSSFTNQDAVWSFSITPQGESIASIDSLTFHFQWDNTTAGSGWRTNFRYVARIRRDSPTGTIIKEFGQNLEGVSGNWDVPRDGLGLSANTTYYITLNVKNNDNGSAPLSSMKAFSTSATADIVSWTSSAANCTPPTSVTLNGQHGWTYSKPGQGVEMQIIGGGGGNNNAFTNWYIQELIYVPGHGEVTAWLNATNANGVASSAAYAPTTRTVTMYPTQTRGQNKRFRIRAEGAAGSSFVSAWYETPENIATNRLPNTCTDLTLNKARAIPGETIQLSFLGGGDPDNNLVRYQVRAYDENGNLYNDGIEMAAQLDVSKNYVDIDLSVDPAVFKGGTKWQFDVRGLDGAGEGGAWSQKSPIVEIAGIVHINDASGAPKDAIPYVFDSTGSPKQALPYCFDVNGIPKMGI